MPRGVYPRPSAAIRMAPMFTVDVDTGCWNWQRGRDMRGYGRFDQRFAHIVSYEMKFGKVPGGLVLDHLCSNPACINPDHLEPVTQRENVARSRSHVARKMTQTECDRGHPLSGDNLYMTPNGRRQCRACARLRSRFYQADDIGGRNEDAD